MTLSFYPISKNNMTIAAGGYLDIEFLTPGDKSFYLKTIFCNKQEIGMELKDDASSYTSEPLNVNFFAEDQDTDIKIIFGAGQRLRVRLHNWTDADVKNLSFALIGYKVTA